jgi:drug/metabolite transporter (DMT)-like permease
VNSSYDPACLVERVVPGPAGWPGLAERRSGDPLPGEQHSHPSLGVGLIFTAATLFALNGTVSKLVLTNGLSSLRLVEIRCLAATVIFALIALRRPRSLRITPRAAGFIAVYGVVGLAMAQWLYFVAIIRMPVSVSLLIEFTAPLR